MNNISDLANKYNEANNQKRRKPSFEIRKEHFAKDLANLTFNPNVNKKYRLNSRYKKLQLGSRVTIAALATALGLGMGAIHNNFANINQNPDRGTVSVSELNQEDILKNAEEALLQCIYGNDLDNINNSEIEYAFDIHDGSSALKVLTSDKIVFTYCNTLSFDHILNDKEISNLIEQMLYLENHSDNVSQKKLQNLNNSLEDLEGKKFKLKDKHIVAVDEKEMNYER